MFKFSPKTSISISIIYPLSKFPHIKIGCLILILHTHTHPRCVCGGGGETERMLHMHPTLLLKTYDEQATADCSWPCDG